MNHIVWHCQECEANLIGGRKAGEHKLKTGHTQIEKTSERVEIE